MIEIVSTATSNPPPPPPHLQYSSKTSTMIVDFFIMTHFVAHR